jgi:hypothetical protein
VAGIFKKEAHMQNPSWAVEQVKGWRETNTNSLSPSFKECLDVVLELADQALTVSAALAAIQSIAK